MMASTLSHSAALGHPPATGGAASAASPMPSTYGTQTLPIAVPLPDFWHQQRPSPSNASLQLSQHGHLISHHPSTSPNPSYASLANPDSSQHHAIPRSHQQSHQQPSSSSTSSTAPTHTQSTQPPQSNNPYSQPAYSNCYYREPASTDNSLPIHHHYPIASTSTTSAVPTANAASSALNVEQQPSSSQKNASKQTAGRASSPAGLTKKSSNRDRSATVEVQQQQKPESSHQSKSQDGGPDTSAYNEGEEGDIDDDPELTARFSSVSQIEAQPKLDPDTGEAVYPCPFCDKNYGGKHARSIWRRHLSNKHGIPLNLQPRRTRWDNDVNRPKDEAERHKRTLESKRRWAAKNRAEKRAKRKGTTVEEELGLIEAAEAAGNDGSTGHDDEHDVTDESFNANDSSGSFSHTASGDLLQPYPVRHQQPAGYWHDAQHGQAMSTSRVAYPQQDMQHAQSGSLTMQPENVQHPNVMYAHHSSAGPPSYYTQLQYIEQDAGHPSYSVMYPVYSLPPDSSEAVQYQRSPSQGEFPSQVQQQEVSYATSLSPIDASFQYQQQQARYAHPVYASQPQQAGHAGRGTEQQPLQHTRLLQSVPLIQQPFLAPPSAHHAPSLQRSVSAPIPQAPSFTQEHSYHHLPVDTEVLTMHAPTPYAHHAAAPRFVSGPVASQAPVPAGAGMARSASSRGMTIYIPPPPQVMPGWAQNQDQQSQDTPIAQPVPVYPVQQGQNENSAPSYQQQQQQIHQPPPTPYFYLSVPQSTPIAEHQPPVSAVLRPVQMEVRQLSSGAVTQSSSEAAHTATTAAVAPITTATVAPNVGPVAEPSAKEQTKTKRRKESKKKSSPTDSSASNKTNKKKSHTDRVQPIAATIPQKVPKALHATKTYQEAAMQLLALKTASSSPPASPVKDFSDWSDHEGGDEEMWRSTDGEGSLAASVTAEDSGYAIFRDEDAPIIQKATATAIERGQVAAEQQEEDEEEAEQERRALRFASIPPSSPAPLRMSLSPESSPLPLVPSKLSATYLRAQASAGRSTPMGIKRKSIRRDSAENDENAEQQDDSQQEEDKDEGERISLDSSPEREDDEAMAPLAKRRLLSMSSVSPRSRMRRGGQSTSGTSRSPSPSRYTSGTASSFATSVIMSTPYLASERSIQASSSLPGGLFSFSQGLDHGHAGDGLDTAAGAGANNQQGRAGQRYSHRHRSSIFKIDNCSRPSAGLGMASSSSPSRPFLLSSPEHAAVSKSLGLVPDNFTNTSLSLPSDGEGFEMHFLRGFGGGNNSTNNEGLGSGSLGGGKRGNGVLSEYAKDVFGGFLGGE